MPRLFVKISGMIFTVGWVGILFYGLYRTEESISRHRRTQVSIVDNPPLAFLGPKAIQAITLGHKGLYDDFIVMWSIQYLMDPRLKAEDPNHVVASLHTILRHEPRVESIYLLACFILANDLARPAECAQIARYGIFALPHSWRIPATIGFIAQRRLGDNAAAAALFAEAASKPNCPRTFGSLSQKLQKQLQLSPDEMEEAYDAIIKTSDHRSRWPAKPVEKGS